MTNSDVTSVGDDEFGCRSIGAIVAESTNEKECSRVVAHSLLHAFCSPFKIPDATATNLIHPRGTSRPQNSEPTTLQTSERSAPQLHTWTAAHTATCRNTMPPPPFPKPLWSKQQTTHGEASPHWLHDKGTPDRGIEVSDHIMSVALATQNRTRWLDHPCPHIKPPQEQYHYQLEQQGPAAYTKPRCRTQTLWMGTTQTKPSPYHVYAPTKTYASLTNGPLT
jgi:hypothetical protein